MSTGLYSGVSGLAIGVGLYKGTQGLWSGASGLITGDGGSTLSLNFLAGAPLDNRITFARASTATFVGSNGLIQTAAVDTPRFDYNPDNLTAKGLLIEEQRTNLVTYSAQFDNAAWTKVAATISADVATSPDGTTNADKLVEDTSAASHLARQSVSVTTGTSYTFFAYAKAAERSVLVLQLVATGFGTARTVWYDLATGTVSKSTGTSTSTITPAGNGWYLCTITATASATAATNFLVFMDNSPTGTGSYTGDGTSGLYLWGAQLEAGAFATSYIPTVAAQVTRSADVATMTGTNFSSWYNQTEGTFVGSFDAFSPASTMLWAGISDGTSSNRLQSGSSSGSSLFVNVGGVNQVTLSSSAVTANTITNRAITYKTDDFAVCTAGGSVATDTLGTLPTVDRLAVGGLNSGSQINGHIRSITYYPQRLPDATLQALTS